MALADTLIAKPPPLRETEGGIIRVSESRVTLETILWAYLDGDSAEEIASSYPTVSLGDIHAVIAYYLANRGEVDAYLAESGRWSVDVRRQNEDRWPSRGLRARLLARMAARQ